MACYLTPVRHSARAINPFFPRFPAQDLAPLFKLFDESFEPVSRAVRSFQPRFDVREEKDAFHLQGELPGINQQDVKIEFADQNTLTIHGRTVRESTRGTPPSAAAVEGEKAKAPIADAPATASEGEAAAPAAGTSRASSVSHQATVEDEDGGVHTPATTTASEAAAPAEQEAPKTEKKQQRQPSSRYWVSERSVGEFHRSFNFPGHVDQEAVKASLKNGILSVIVPKAAAKEPKQIAVE